MSNNLKNVIEDINKDYPDEYDEDEELDSFGCPLWMEQDLKNIISYMIENKQIINDNGDLVPVSRFGVFSLLLQKTPVFIFSNKIIEKHFGDTAFTDGINIFINKDFYSKLITAEQDYQEYYHQNFYKPGFDKSIQEKLGVVPILLHELSHILEDDVYRLTDYDPLLANIAQDLLHNTSLQLQFPDVVWIDYLKEFGYGFKAQDRKYADMSEEEIAEELYKLKKEQEEKQKEEEQQQETPEPESAEQDSMEIPDIPEQEDDDEESQEDSIVSDEQDDSTEKDQDSAGQEESEEEGQEGDSTDSNGDSEDSEENGEDGQDSKNKDKEKSSGNKSGKGNSGDSEGGSEDDSDSMEGEDLKDQLLSDEEKGEGKEIDMSSDIEGNPDNSGTYNDSKNEKVEDKEIKGKSKSRTDIYNQELDEQEVNGKIHTRDPKEVHKVLEEAGLGEVAEKLGYPSKDADEQEKEEAYENMKTEHESLKERTVQEAIAEADSSGAGSFYPGSVSLSNAKKRMKQNKEGVLKWKQVIQKAIWGTGMKQRYNDDIPNDIYYVEDLKELLGMNLYQGTPLSIKSDDTVLFLIDTSGSMCVDKRILQDIVNECISFKRAAANSDAAREVMIVSADTDMRGEPTIINEDNIEEFLNQGFNLNGYGGTCLTTSINSAINLEIFKEKKIKSIIYFTDLGDMPPKLEDLNIEKDVSFTYIATGDYRSMLNFFKKEVADYASVVPLLTGEEIDLSLLKQIK